MTLKKEGKHHAVVPLMFWTSTAGFSTTELSKKPFNHSLEDGLVWGRK